MAKNPSKLNIPKVSMIRRPLGVCGCGKPALYEVYEDRQPHCRDCMLDAADNEIYIEVRRYDGGFNDAS